MLSRRERILALAVLIAVSIVVLDRYVITPVAAAYASLDERREKVGLQLLRAEQLIIAQGAATQRWTQMESHGLLTDGSQAESQLLHAVRTWSRQSGITLVSIQPERAPATGELREITFQTNATGSIQAITRFLHLMQEATLPVRVKRLRIAGAEGREHLAVDMRLSTIYYAEAPPDRRPTPSAIRSSATPRTAAAGAPQPYAMLMAAAMLSATEDEDGDNGDGDDDMAVDITPQELAELLRTAQDEAAPSAETAPQTQAPPAADDAAQPPPTPLPAAPEAQPTPRPSIRTGTTQRGTTSRTTAPTRSEDNEPTPPIPASDTWNHYRVVIDRNIFNRDRQAATASRPTREVATEPIFQPEPPADPARSLVLRGISLIDDETYAFFESTRDYTYRQVQVGQTIERRTVRAITLDGVEVLFEDRPLTIKVGSNLRGDGVEAPAAGSAAGAPAATTPELSALEERMRQRRLQEAQR